MSYIVDQVLSHVKRMIRFLPSQFKGGYEPPNTSEGFPEVNNNITEFLQIIASEINEIDGNLFKLLTMRGLLVAEGVHLDNLGQLLNLPRPYADTDLGDYFGFQGAVEAIPFGFGDPLDPSVGGTLASPGEDLTGDRPLLDEEYRVILLVKVIRDNYRANHDNLIRAIKLSTGATDVTVLYTIPESGRAEITFSRPLTGFERVAIRLAKHYLPIPLGCKVDIIDN